MRVTRRSGEASYGTAGRRWMIRGPRRDSDTETQAEAPIMQARRQVSHVGASDPWLPSHMEREPEDEKTSSRSSQESAYPKQKLALRSSQKTVATGVVCP
jgi:hypothetical protein